MTKTDARPRIRLCVEESLGPAARVTLGEALAHYLVHVMRAEVGTEVALFNGRDGEWRARLAAATRRGATIETLSLLRPQGAEPDLWLVFAPIKRARLDFVAEKATELGVSELRPVRTARTVVDRVNRERMAANAREAAEQTDRLSVPVCQPMVPLGDMIAAWPAGRRLLFCDESGAGAPIAAALDAARAAGACPWAVLTGPEGGFTPAEAEALRAIPGALGVGLGPRLLRADTAALAALACWQAVLGDWYQTPRSE
ncbi:MAG: 16S rRNA (uracil(1498)-N(3))-methyltransferase [Alphaproteobacteria bacterium]|nr:16S rRNA (uracil(1498)-N(3))-methyltransferase [Alphaproteobacteria bacterium]